MKNKKCVVIITDDSEKTAEIAAEIAGALKGGKVSVIPAPDFKGNDILPAEALFLGCEKPAPDCFGYLADLLKHINLAGRPCGIFSPGSKQALKYLADMVKDCEAALNPEAFSGGGAAVKTWAEAVVSGSF